MWPHGEGPGNKNLEIASSRMNATDRRWEYLHSPFHAAAYGLDPEFMETAGDLDEATMEGLRAVFDRFALRDAILASS